MHKNFIYKIFHSSNDQTVLYYPSIGPCQSGIGYDGNEGVLHFLQSSRIEASLSDGIVSYPGDSRGGGVLTPLQRSSQYILQPQLIGLFNMLRIEQ